MVLPIVLLIYPFLFLFLSFSLWAERRVLAVCWPQGDAQFNDMEDYSAGIEVPASFSSSLQLLLCTSGQVSQ